MAEARGACRTHSSFVFDSLSDRLAHAKRISLLLRILVVDAEPGALKLTKTLIELLGCEASTLADSRQAAGTGPRA
jgi:hypothetical protein